MTGIDEFIQRFLQFEEANFKSFETHNTLVAGSHPLKPMLATARGFIPDHHVTANAELNRGTAELAALQAEAAALQAAIHSGDAAIVEEALRVQESCPSRVAKV